MMPLFLFLLGSFTGQAVNGTPGNFDYYLFTLSWSPEFCQSHASNTECAVGKHYAFIVHGMWPEFKTGKYPEHCSTAPGPSDTSFLKDVMPDPSLIAHEWTTHGTCSGLSANDYFHFIADTFQGVHAPASLNTTSHPVSVAPAAIKQAFLQADPKLRANGIAVTCSGNFLTAVQLCLGKDGTGIACPASVRDCRAAKISVPPVP